MSLMTQISTCAIVFSVRRYQNDIASIFMYLNITVIYIIRFGIFAIPVETKSLLLLFKLISLALQDDEFMQRKEKAIKTVNEISVSVKCNAL